MANENKVVILNSNGTVNEIRNPTSEEQTLFDGNPFQNALDDFRLTRNNLLAKTDYLALSDNTMSSELSTYRQQLRDCTTGLDTVEKIEAYEFPEEVTS
jgi:protease II